MRRVPDVTLCERLLGVRASVDIDDGLAPHDRVAARASTQKLSAA